MIKYVLLDKDRFVQNNSDVDFDGATKIIFQDDWENDFNRFYRKFYVKENGAVLHPDNLPTDPITNQLSSLQNKVKEANDALTKSDANVTQLSNEKQQLEDKVKTLSNSNDKFLSMISSMYGNFAEFQNKLAEKQDKDSSNEEKDSSNQSQQNQ